MLVKFVLTLWIFVSNVVLAEKSYCNINFPNPQYIDSSKFQVTSNFGDFSNLKTYEPNEQYNVEIQLPEISWNNWKIKAAFIKLNSLMDDDTIGNTGILHYNESRINEVINNCKNILSVQFKNDYQQNFHLVWNTPPKTTAINKSKIKRKCIKITIVLLIERKADIKYSTGRTFLLCEPEIKKNVLDAMSSDLSGQPSYTNVIDNNVGCDYKQRLEPVKSCKIDSVAIYRIVIENKWNHLNHWKDWPGRDGFSPELTEIMGASHSPKFNLYNYGGITSPEIQSICLNGSYSSMEKLFRKSGDDIVTVILARPLKVGANSGKRSALLAVNKSHHLVSFLTRLNPSPDWCTGLSRVDLCDGRCSWPNTFTVNIYPWDAGVNSGTSYLSVNPAATRNRPTATGSNKPLTCPITSSWPRDNPFTQINGQIQPLGVVNFQLVLEMNKNKNTNCIEQSEQPIPSDQAMNSVKTSSSIRHCQFTQWSLWSQCSVSCGKGTKSRYRRIIKGNPTKCRRLSIKEIVSCSDLDQCPTKSETPNPTISICQMRLWGQWSPCNATCTDPGVRYRSRVFLNHQEQLACQQYDSMTQLQTCRQATTRCASPRFICTQQLDKGSNCLWSNSSVRYYFNMQHGKCMKFEYNGCYGNLNQYVTKKNCVSFCGKLMANTNNYESATLPIKSLNNQMNVACDQSVNWGNKCENNLEDEDNQPMDRWYFDKVHRRCFRFKYEGCFGNFNNFANRTTCEQQCVVKYHSTSRPEEKQQQPQSNIHSTPITHKQSITNYPAECIYTAWSQWTNECSDSCHSTETRVRYLRTTSFIITDSCPGKQLQKRPCDLDKCQMSISDSTELLPCKYSEWSEWTKCNAKCGRGLRQRQRQKLNHPSVKCVPQFPQFEDREYCYNDCWRN